MRGNSTFYSKKVGKKTPEFFCPITFLKMEIVDNFLEEEHFELLHRIVLSTYFTWNYMGKQSYVETEDSFQFQHTFYREEDSPSEYYAIIEPILEKLKGTLIRAKAVLTPKTENPRHSGFHIDYANMKTATYYLNSNNGYTGFRDGSRVESVSNRMLVFDSNLEHEGVTCTDKKRRVLINFNINNIWTLNSGIQKI